MLSHRTYYFLTLVIICCSCRQTLKSDALLESLQGSMERSSLTIQYMTETVLAELNEKSTDSPTSYKAGIWLSKAELVKRYTRDLILRIDQLKDARSGSAQDNDLTDKSALKKSLTAYADSVLTIDSLIRKEFAAGFDHTIHDKRHFPSLWETMKSLDQAGERERTVLLTQLKLSVTERGNAIICFCNEQVSDYCGFRIFSVIVAQNSHAITPGEKLEIIAGVGSFSLLAQPKISVNGRLQPLNEDATVKYTFKPTGKPGLYHIPVVVDFIDENGKPQTIKRDVMFRLIDAPVVSAQ